MQALFWTISFLLLLLATIFCFDNFAKAGACTVFTHFQLQTRSGQHRRSTKGWMVVQKMKTGWRRASYGLNDKNWRNAECWGQHVRSCDLVTRKKNWLRNCTSLWERCKCNHFSLSGHWTPGRIGATTSCRWWLWFAGGGPRCVFRSEWLRPDSVGATALVTGWWGSGSGVAVEPQGCCRIIWCRGEGKKIACGRIAYRK